MDKFDQQEVTNNLNTNAGDLCSEDMSDLLWNLQRAKRPDKPVAERVCVQIQLVFASDMMFTYSRAQIAAPTLQVVSEASYRYVHSLTHRSYLFPG